MEIKKLVEICLENRARATNLQNYFEGCYFYQNGFYCWERSEYQQLHIIPEETMATILSEMGQIGYSVSNLTFKEKIEIAEEFYYQNSSSWELRSCNWDHLPAFAQPPAIIKIIRNQEFLSPSYKEKMAEQKKWRTMSAKDKALKILQEGKKIPKSQHQVRCCDCGWAGSFFESGNHACKVFKKILGKETWSKNRKSGYHACPKCDSFNLENITAVTREQILAEIEQERRNNNASRSFMIQPIEYGPINSCQECGSAPVASFQIDSEKNGWYRGTLQIFCPKGHRDIKDERGYDTKKDKYAPLQVVPIT